MVFVLSSSPNTDGLTAACARAAVNGLQSGGKDAVEIRINDENIGLCQACGNGWGTCRSDHHCQIIDGFQDLHEKIRNAEALVLVTPVYYGEMSESMKAFTDRLRRCEASAGDRCAFAGKQVLSIPAAGGGGGGLPTCAASMDRFIQHVKANRFDLVTVNRWNREIKLKAITGSAKAMAESLGKPDGK